MKGTILQFVRSGDGTATVTIKLSAQPTGQSTEAKSAEEEAKRVAEFEKTVSGHYEAFKAYHTEVEIGFTAAPHAGDPVMSTRETRRGPAKE